MSKLKAEVIKYSKKLNITNLSALRSGNISVRAKDKGIDGFYITPSGREYGSLKPLDIVFVSLKGVYDKKKGKPSSEWRFHQDIYVNKKEAKAIVHAHSTCATAVSTHPPETEPEKSPFSFTIIRLPTCLGEDPHVWITVAKTTF